MTIGSVAFLVLIARAVVLNGRNNAELHWREDCLSRLRVRCRDVENALDIPSGKIENASESIKRWQKRVAGALNMRLAVIEHELECPSSNSMKQARKQCGSARTAMYWSRLLHALDRRLAMVEQAAGLAMKESQVWIDAASGMQIMGPRGVRHPRFCWRPPQPGALLRKVRDGVTCGPTQTYVDRRQRQLAERQKAAERIAL